MTIKRTKLGFLWAFDIQYEGLLLSSLSYDAGHRGEASRMANAMYILLGPSSRNHTSIIEQLGFSTATKVISTAHAHNEPSLGTSPLAAAAAWPYIKSDGTSGGWFISGEPHGHEYLSTGQSVALETWWGERVLSAAGPGGTLNRLQIAKVMRDRDGGAHLDGSINDESYAAIVLHGAGYVYKPSADSAESRPVEGMIEATIRQMAYEVLYSLKSLSLTAKQALAEAGKTGGLTRKLFISE